MADFAHAFARRTRLRGGDELTAILAGSPPGVLSMTGGFPNPATFPTDELDEIAARLVREDAAVALQYTPCAGIESVREYLIDRQEQLQGRRPERDELIVTSGGMECIAMMCQALIDPGDTIAVEAPSYLGALMAFGAAEADAVAIAMDDEGLRVDALAERLAAGLRPKFVYTIPEYQNPTGRTLSLDRRRELVELCRRHGVLIFEDVAYRELSFDGTSLPTLWSLAPDVVLQAGTFSKSFFPGVRLGWATGPTDVVAELAAAKQTTDQCAGALGQRLVEEYGRAGGFERHLPAARALYASHWAALSAALRSHMPAEVDWTEPTGGFLTWLTLAEELDTLAMRPAAMAAGVAYVPGPPFHVGDDGSNTLRLSFSHLTETELETAVERLAAVVRAALEQAEHARERGAPSVPSRAAERPSDHSAMLEVALAEARTGLEEGGIPIGGALFDSSGTLLGRGRNRRVQHDDPSAHAEVDAFRNAGRRRTYGDTIMSTTLAPCWYCSGLIRQFGIPTVVVGESQTFRGGIDWLRECGVEVIDLNSQECIDLLGSFIARRPDVWNEDIGV